MAVISKNQVSFAGEFAVLSNLATVFALALLTPAVGADIYAHENFVVIWGRIDRGDDAVFKETVTLATRTIYLVSPGGYLDPALRIAVMVGNSHRHWRHEGRRSSSPTAFSLEPAMWTCREG